MITWLPALLRIVGRIINGIMNVNAIKECRLLCDFQMRKVCYSEIKQEANRVRRMTLLQIMLKRNASSATAELLFHF